jgi:hypothetical protein
MAEAFEVPGDRLARIALYFDPAQFAPPGGQAWAPQSRPR